MMKEYHQASYPEPLLCEIPEKGVTRKLPSWDYMMAEEELLPKGLIRKSSLEIPDLSEPEVARHFFRLSQMNYCIESGFYPLGSCTMKYNPKFTDRIASLRYLKGLHPLQPNETSQGILSILYELKQALAEIGGMDEVTLQPAAGAHGEYTGMNIVRKYFEVKEEARDEVIIPDSAHGTNPASATMNGFRVVEIPSNERGRVNIEALKAALNNKTAAFMITNPNTLGNFEDEILEIARIVHKNGSLLYYDGANLNAVMGWVRPGDMGFDVMHFNLHKTFATPHGGGGPGSGPVGVKEFLREYLPVPLIVKKDGRYLLRWDLKHSIGKVRAYMGNVAVAVRAWAYIMVMGGEGLRMASTIATLNSNYLMRLIKELLPIPYEGIKKHEFVASSEVYKDVGGSAKNISKALLDKGIHAPTIYFPLIVHEALMIEPTETEPMEEMKRFADALKMILSTYAEEDYNNAPKNTSSERVDEVFAAKNLLVKWDDIKKQ